MCSPVKATVSATIHHAVALEAVTTTTAEFRFMTTTNTGTMPAMLTGSAAIDPGTIADGAGVTGAGITVTGAAMGDVVLIGAPYDVEDVTMTAWVQAANTVEIRWQNESTASWNPGSGTWTVQTWTPAAAGVSVAGTNPDPAEGDGCNFVAVGLRNN